ncbi:hypothetical protein CMQ_731 [Grosmannia clavigera kw1407]|uniref:Uncharacterized protein n=1 Tax=Grosmannia clavigera (strain kw1407 / UAMH 11150) TaxID=655863 RepID=F0XD31_GROCL|nr:uncharacterized protein CMQ_731 [Grosmannia clavigera kw1407]EFX03803.1 hypothetical protein CMQ_731 [Grosmannia clavigera kw1407]
MSDNVDYKALFEKDKRLRLLAEEKSERGSTGAGSSSRSVRAARKSYLAYAFSRTYYYMLLSGIEFGYLATGETLVLLRIPEDEPTTLLYHFCGYPVTSPQDRSSYAPPGATKPASVATDPVSEVELAKLAIAQLCSLCILASNSPVRPDAWIARALAGVATYPESPSSITGDGGSKARRPSLLQQDYTTGHTLPATTSWRDDEKRIYAGLQAPQGVLIPVFLGLLKLVVPYPLPVKFTVLPYMMLMSYAGESVYFATAEDDDMVDFSQEVDRTLQDLANLGLYDSDDNEANVTWCKDTRRVMKIDFERAHLTLGSHQGSLGPPTPASAEPGAQHLALRKRQYSTERPEVSVLNA